MNSIVYYKKINDDKNVEWKNLNINLPSFIHIGENICVPHPELSDTHILLYILHKRYRFNKEGNITNIEYFAVAEGFELNAQQLNNEIDNLLKTSGF